MSEMTQRLLQWTHDHLHEFKPPDMDIAAIAKRAEGDLKLVIPVRAMQLAMHLACMAELLRPNDEGAANEARRDMGP